jgi:class 3 adenylate cyclase
MGGKVAKKLGDGLTALFGYPVAQENDAERAVRAAIAIYVEGLAGVIGHADPAKPLRDYCVAAAAKELVGLRSTSKAVAA